MRVTENGRITILKHIRDLLDIRYESEVEFIEEKVFIDQGIILWAISVSFESFVV